MNRDRIASVASFAIVLVLWEWACRAGWVAEYTVPAPTVIVTYIARTFRLLLFHTYTTAVEILLGFLFAVIVGIGAAISMVYVRTVERVLYPWIIVSQVVPKVAVGPL